MLDDELREALRAYLTRARDGHELHQYWTAGAGLGKWSGSPRPFSTLLGFLRKYMPEEKARRTTAEWFREVKGYLPGGKPETAKPSEPTADPVTLREQRERERRKQRKRGARRSLEDAERARTDLKHYWLHGEGAGRWERWTELYNHLRKHMSDGRAKRVAAQWFFERHGYWPGADKNRVAHGKPPRGQVVGPG